MAGLVILALGVAPVAAAAQDARPPRRPRLARDADTNSAVAYYDWGIERLRRQPREAAAAFYWAERLDPVSPAIPYARYVTAMLNEANRLVGYFHREPDVLRADAILRADSLFLRAVRLDPFVDRGLDELLLIEYGRRVVRRDEFLLRQDQQDTEIVHEMRRYFADSDPFLAGLMSANRQERALALTYYGQALQNSRQPDRVNYERATTFYLMRSLDSAKAAIGAAAAYRLGDQARTVFERPAQWWFGVGVILELQGRRDSAGASYQRALALDAGHYAARIRLAGLTARTGDTAAALAQLEGGLDAGDVFDLRIALGNLYARAGRAADADRHFRRAMELEPWAASAWLQAGRAADAAGDTLRAIETYTGFLRRAARTDRNAAAVRARLEALGSP